MKKRIFAAFSTVVLLLLVCIFPASAAGDFEPPTVKDALLAVRAAVDHQYNKEYDVNEDGTVNLLDALRLLKTTANPPLVTLTVEGTPRAGETFTLTAAIENNPGLVGLQIYLAYDSAICTYLSAEAPSNGFNTQTSPTEGANPYKLVCANLSLKNVTADAVLARATFTVAPDAPTGAYALSVTSLKAYQGKDILPVKLYTYGAELVIAEEDAP